MTLMERIQDRTECRVDTCHEQRSPDSDLCGPHTNDKFMHRLDRNPDGTYSMRRTFRARLEWPVAA